MAKKNLFEGFDTGTKAAGNVVALTNPQAVPPDLAETLPAGAATRQKTRQGKKMVTYYLDPAEFRRLKLLSAGIGRTLQELNEEALELLWAKYDS